MSSERLLDRFTELTRSVKRVRREASAGSPDFDLAYFRNRPRPSVSQGLGSDATAGRLPTVVLPGGPGLSSTLPYGTLRRQAKADGLDLIMIDHRGVGLSRFDLDGAPLPQSAMWVDNVLDDIAAVLDVEGVGKANIVGSSYGSYLASAFGAKYPERVAGMLLDSTLQSAGDLQIERDTIRALFWDSDSELAALVRQVGRMGENQRVLLDVVRAGYELCGPRAVRSILRLRTRGRRGLAWRMLESYAARDASIAEAPDYYEFERAGAIGFRELNYAPKPDGKPLDPALTYSKIAGDFPQFGGESRDLVAATEGFRWPLVLLVGDRDIRTPAAIARRAERLAPNPVLIEIENGHSALDTHPVALVKATKLLAQGRATELRGLGPKLSALPRHGGGAAFAKAICVAARLGNLRV